MHFKESVIDYLKAPPAKEWHPPFTETCRFKEVKQQTNNAVMAYKKFMRFRET